MALLNKPRAHALNVSSGKAAYVLIIHSPSHPISHANSASPTRTSPPSSAPSPRQPITRSSSTSQASTASCSSTLTLPGLPLPNPPSAGSVRALQRRRVDALCWPRPPRHQARKCVPFSILIVPFALSIPHHTRHPIEHTYPLRAHPTLRPRPRPVHRPQHPAHSHTLRLRGLHRTGTRHLRTRLRSSRSPRDRRLGLRHHPLCRVCLPAAV